MNFRLSVLGAVLGVLTPLGSALAEDPNPMPAPVPAWNAPSSAVTGTPVSRNGIVEVTVNVYLKSPIPTSQPIYCWVGLYPFPYYLYSFDSAQKAATRNGNVATCVVSVPYSWNYLDLTGTSYIGLSLSVFSGSMAAATAVPWARYAARTLPSISPIPANGVKSQVTVSLHL